MDGQLQESASRTDIGEMAQLSAVESIAALVGQRSSSLFETTPVEIQQSVKGLSTKVGFSTLVHDFFSRLTQRFLSYHLSRELSNHVGNGQRFNTPSEHTEFLNQLAMHCRQAA